MSLDRSFNRSGHCMAKKKSSGIANAVVPATRKKSQGRWIKTKITIGGYQRRTKASSQPAPEVLILGRLS